MRMKNPSSLAELVEAVELAEASFAHDVGERAVSMPRRVTVERHLPEGTSRPVSRPAPPRKWMSPCRLSTLSQEHERGWLAV